jgi:hypothetical protein
MCECSATHSESKPRSSSATASSAGEIDYSVKKIEAPISIIVPLLGALPKYELAQRCTLQLKVSTQLPCAAPAANLQRDFLQKLYLTRALASDPGRPPTVF